MASPDRPSVLVVGAGIVGSCAGYFLACREARVQMIDRDPDPSATTRASLGVLTHFQGGDDPYSTFYRDAHALHAELARQLREETGLDVGWRALGGIDLAFGDAEVEEARSRLRDRGRNCRWEWLDHDRVRRLEPKVSFDVSGGVYFPDDHRVDPPALGHALRTAAAQRGAVVRLGCELLRIEAGGGGVKAWIGEETQNREERFDFAVLAAGSWTGELVAEAAGGPRIRPVRGQHCRYRGGSEIGHLLRWGGHHLIPAGGAIVVGATVEEVGFDTRTTEAAAAEFAGVFGRVLDMESILLSQAAGLRPKPRKGKPVIGPVDPSARLFVASGHYRNGVLLGPLTGRVLADWIVAGQASRDMSFFGIRR